MAGQTSRGNKAPKKVLPSLAVSEEGKINLQNYDAKKLCEAVEKRNPNSMNVVRKGVLIDMGFEEESTTTGNKSITAESSSTTGSEPPQKIADLSDHAVGKFINEKAKEIQEALEQSGERWASCSPAERMLAASASPAALYAELCEQLSDKSNYVEKEKVEEYNMPAE